MFIGVLRASFTLVRLVLLPAGNDHRLMIMHQMRQDHLAHHHGPRSERHHGHVVVLGAVTKITLNHGQDHFLGADQVEGIPPARPNDLAEFGQTRSGGTLKLCVIDDQVLQKGALNVRVCTHDLDSFDDLALAGYGCPLTFGACPKLNASTNGGQTNQLI